MSIGRKLACAKFALVGQSLVFCSHRADSGTFPPPSDPVGSGDVPGQSVLVTALARAIAAKLAGRARRQAPFDILRSLVNWGAENRAVSLLEC